ncbi:MAG: hypothetical protein M3071_10890 [Actinomycetota bacterium]|nr:hypothetical protein [Actinomycetota bacterium]
MCPRVLRRPAARAEIKRLDWPDAELDGYRLVVRKAKSQAGTGRRPPIAEPLRAILLGEFMRQGRRDGGAVGSALKAVSARAPGVHLGDLRPRSQKLVPAVVSGRNEAVHRPILARRTR